MAKQQNIPVDSLTNEVNAKYQKNGLTYISNIPTVNVRDEAGNKADGEKFHLMQHTMKILLNSLYGATALGSFRYGNVILSESITLSGQRIIQESAYFANTHMNKVMRGEIELIPKPPTNSEPSGSIPEELKNTIWNDSNKNGRNLGRDFGF